MNQYTSVTFTDGTVKPMNYDLRGNTALFGTTNYTYDAENRMTHAFKNSGGGAMFDALYGYDPFGHRAFKNVDGVLTFFLGDTLDDEIAEYTSGGTLLRRYIPGPGVDEPVAMIDLATATTRFFHEDRIGSVIATSSTSGALIDGPYSYTPFGESCIGTGENNCTMLAAGGGIPFRFTGRRLDPRPGSSTSARAITAPARAADGSASRTGLDMPMT